MTYWSLVEKKEHFFIFTAGGQVGREIKMMVTKGRSGLKKKKKEDWILKKGRIKSVSNKCKKKSATQLENGKKNKSRNKQTKKTSQKQTTTKTAG